MASVNVPVENPFLTQIERVRVEILERVARAHQVLQERETALLSELQQLEDTYRGEGVARQIHEFCRLSKQAVLSLQRIGMQEVHKQFITQLDARMREPEASAETAGDRMRRVELEWDGNLEGLLSRTGSIRVSSAHTSKEKVYSIMQAGKHRNYDYSTPVLFSYFSIAFVAETNIFYICGGDQHLQVFNEFSLTLCCKMNSTIGIFLHLNKVYVPQCIADSFTIYSNENRYIHPSELEGQEKLEFICITKDRSKAVLVENYNDIPSKYKDGGILSPTTCESRVNNSPLTDCIFTNYILEEFDPLYSSIEINPARGLKNLGNTCFMNSVIQCLSHTLPLRQLYVSDEYKLYINNNRGDLSNAFKHVMVNLWNTTSSDSVSPYSLKRQVGIAAPIFSDNNQHDAHEFLRFLLNELHEEINRASEEGRKSPDDNETLKEACARHLSWEDSRISQLFSGMLRSDVCCSVCNNQSTAYIPFMDLSLPIPERNELSCSYYEQPIHLADCLKMITTEETLMEEERPYCNTCRDLTTSTKQLIICTLPKFLVIQLKRFSYYPTRTKLSTPLRFDDTWRLKDSSNSTHTYSLYGIACHSGSLYGGHYIAYCKYSRVWRCLNDSRTSIVSWEHVRNQEAYILFYEVIREIY